MTQYLETREPPTVSTRKKVLWPTFTHFIWFEKLLRKQWDHQCVSLRRSLIANRNLAEFSGMKLHSFLKIDIRNLPLFYFTWMWVEVTVILLIGMVFFPPEPIEDDDSEYEIYEDDSDEEEEVYMYYILKKHIKRTFKFNLELSLIPDSWSLCNIQFLFSIHQDDSVDIIWEKNILRRITISRSLLCGRDSNHFPLFNAFTEYISLHNPCLSIQSDKL